MHPITFKEANTMFAKDQPQYSPLPSHKTEDGIVTSCWKFTWKERLIALFTGRIFVSQMAFNQPLQPLRLAVGKGEDIWRIQLS